MPEKEKKKKKVKKSKTKELRPVLELPDDIDLSQPLRQRFNPDEPVFFDLSLPTFEKDCIEQERERVDKLNEKTSREETTINKRRLDLRAKAKEILKIPPPAKYQPQEPIKKSAKLREYESQIRKGKFFDVDHKKYLRKNNPAVVPGWKEEPYVYRNTFDSVGLERHLIWKSVYEWAPVREQ